MSTAVLGLAGTVDGIALDIAAAAVGIVLDLQDVAGTLVASPRVVFVVTQTVAA